jgi:hypothetical protein
MKKVLASALVAVSPLVALAQSTTPSQGIAGLFTLIGGILNRIVPLFIALAVVFFIWEVFQYTIAGSEEKKKAAKGGMIWGIVGIFIMVSVWGLVAILQSTFGTTGVSETINSQIPQI